MNVNIDDESAALSTLPIPERKIASAFMQGEAVSFCTGNPEADNPSSGRNWGVDRTVRASFLAAILLGPPPAPIGRPRALTIRGVRIVGDLDLSGTEVNYELNFFNCLFEGQLNISRSRTKTVNFAGSKLDVFMANSTEFVGNVRLNGCKASQVNLIYAHVGGQISLNGAEISNADSVSFNGDGLIALGGLFCPDGFRSTGEFRIPGAQVTGQIDFTGATLINGRGRTLMADGLHVEGGVHCTKGFKSIGEIRLVDASIRSQLAFSEATLSNQGGCALNAQGMSSAEVFFHDNSKVFGSISLTGTQIRHQVSFGSATLVNPLGSAFSFQESQAQSLWMNDVTISGDIDLRSAEIGTINDDPAAWPARIRLDGLVYVTLLPPRPSKGPQGRIAWVQRGANEYRAQPYEHLAANYRKHGHDDDARAVLVAKNRRHAASSSVRGKVLGGMLDAIVGYGYYPLRAVYWLAGLCLVGSFYFNAHRPLPVSPGYHPHYQPILYTMDLILPVVSFGQSSAWNATGPGQWIAAILNILGWILTVAVAAGAGRALFRD